jgi:hypothetical protein
MMWAHCCCRYSLKKYDDASGLPFHWSADHGTDSVLVIGPPTSGKVAIVRKSTTGKLGYVVDSDGMFSIGLDVASQQGSLGTWNGSYTWIKDSGTSNFRLFDSSGSHIASVTYSFPLASYQPTFVTDSGGNLLSLNSGSGFYSEFIWKHNTSGTLVWKYSYAAGPSSPTLAVDSGDNAIVGWNGAFLTKVDSSGALVWNKSGTTVGSLLCCDSSDNIYAAGSGTIYKYSSAGTLSSTWSLGGSVTDMSCSGTNVYILRLVSSVVYAEKYNGSGTLQWSTAVPWRAGAGIAPRDIRSDGTHVWISGNR